MVLLHLLQERDNCFVGPPARSAGELQAAINLSLRSRRGRKTRTKTVL
jgi:hypothetical protein